MTVNQLIKDPIVKLPKTQNDNDFANYLFNLLDVFFDKVKSIDFSNTNIALPTGEITRTENLIKGIKKSIEYYLNGYPFNAYEELKKAFDRSNVFSYLLSNNLSPGYSFYRLRTNEENYSLPQQELFHIPFQKRGNVSTQRYSIPGFPCLYMSNSVYVAWEELGRKPIEKIQASRLENREIFKYLDLTTDIYSGKDNLLTNKTNEEIWSHLVIWPIIAACSIKVFDKNASFKPEYIIPQLLLQIVRNEKELNGIRFSSTHIDLNTSRSEGNFYNFAVPVKEGGSFGHCKTLLKMFEMTEVVPWQLLEVFSRIDMGTTSMGSEYRQRENVSRIELIKGSSPIAYQYSPFGKLEITLDHMQTKSIDSL